MMMWCFVGDGVDKCVLVWIYLVIFLQFGFESVDLFFVDVCLVVDMMYVFNVLGEFVFDYLIDFC